MRLLLACLVSVSFFIGSCIKKDSGCNYTQDHTVAPLAEQQNLTTYIDTSGISATLSPTGFYYKIIKPGSGVVPNPCSQITVAYKGELTNGTAFDQQSNFITVLGGLIAGWQQGLPLIKPGGEIKLYIPPSLGYGYSANGTIPGGSIIVFDITLLNVQ